MAKMTFEANEYMNLLVYGKAGTGKSISLRTLSEGKILYLCPEPGVAVPRFLPELKDRILPFKITKWDQIAPLKDGVNAWAAFHGVNLDGVRLVTLDSATELIGSVIAPDVVNTYPPKANSENLPEIKQFGVIFQRANLVLRGLVNSPYHTYISAHAALVQEKATQEAENIIWFPGSLGSAKFSMTHLVDWIMNSYQSGDGSFMLRPINTESSIGKTRGFKPPPTLPFNFDVLIATWIKIFGS